MSSVNTVILHMDQGELALVDYQSGWPLDGDRLTNWIPMMMMTMMMMMYRKINKNQSRYLKPAMLMSPYQMTKTLEQGWKNLTTMVILPVCYRSWSAWGQALSWGGNVTVIVLS